MEIALDAGADDVKSSDEGFEVICAPNHFYSLSAALEKAGIAAESSEIVYLPNAPMPVGAGDAAKVDSLVEALEELDDVQNVFSGHEAQE
jgi:transcriptional/translational regulatory protein YebC/TACO1